MSFVLVRGGVDLRLNPSGLPILISERRRPLAVRRRVSSQKSFMTTSFGWRIAWLAESAWQ
jgi:hypothetical protein